MVKHYHQIIVLILHGAADADKFTANRRPNHRTANTHCVACYSYKPTANHDGASDGGR